MSTKYYGGSFQRCFIAVLNPLLSPARPDLACREPAADHRHTKTGSELETVILCGCSTDVGFLCVVSHPPIWINFSLASIILSNDKSLIIIFQNDVSFKSASFNFISIPYKGLLC